MAPPEAEEDDKIVTTPRRSRVGVIAAVMLLLATIALLAVAYRGWQLYQSLLPG